MNFGAKKTSIEVITLSGKTSCDLFLYFWGGSSEIHFLREQF